MIRVLKRELRRRFGRDREFYSDIRRMLGIVPDNIELYKLAFIHRSSSVALPGGGVANNERLEFLGDAVLEAIVSDFLFVEHPDEPEGVLTQIRSRIVSRVPMDEMAERMGMGKYIVASFNGTNGNRHIMGNALEALIGAIYLDKGYNFTNRYVINDIIRRVVDVDDLLETETDFKSRLIEWCQKTKRSIRFSTRQSSKSTVHSPLFVSAVMIDGVELGHGEGRNKKEAEQNAAHVVTHILSDDELGDYVLEAYDVKVERYGHEGQAN